ncbi:hypothetical protein JHK86_001364 [Glycine max]|nr:hypothetical protein JHK86_001364 [Glycine max]
MCTQALVTSGDVEHEATIFDKPFTTIDLILVWGVIEALFQHTTCLLTNIHVEASNSILHFLADIFDLANSSVGEQFIPIRDSVIIPRGASITRILVASLTGALLKSRVDVEDLDDDGDGDKSDDIRGDDPIRGLDMLL